MWKQIICCVPDPDPEQSYWGYPIPAPGIDLDDLIFYGQEWSQSER